jgi:hypothetical protein
MIDTKVTEVTMPGKMLLEADWLSEDLQFCDGGREAVRFKREDIKNERDEIETISFWIGRHLTASAINNRIERKRRIADAELARLQAELLGQHILVAPVASVHAVL